MRLVPVKIVLLSIGIVVPTVVLAASAPLPTPKGYSSAQDFVKYQLTLQDQQIRGGALASLKRQYPGYAWEAVHFPIILGGPIQADSGNIIFGARTVTSMTPVKDTTDVEHFCFPTDQTREYTLQEGETLQQNDTKQASTRRTTTVDVHLQATQGTVTLNGDFNSKVEQFMETTDSTNKQNQRSGTVKYSLTIPKLSVVVTKTTIIASHDRLAFTDKVTYDVQLHAVQAAGGTGFRRPIGPWSSYVESDQRTVSFDGSTEFNSVETTKVMYPISYNSVDECVKADPH